MTEAAVIAEPRNRRRARLVLAGVAWAGLIAWWVEYQRRTGLGAVDTAQRLIDAASGNWWAVVAYMAVSLVRPLVLFPATIVTVAAGILFGPFVGVGVAAVAANASAMIGYSIGRNLRRRGDESAVTSRLETWPSRLRANSFEAVLPTRLLFLPYDLVNSGCGLLPYVERRSSLRRRSARCPAPSRSCSSVTRLDDGSTASTAEP